MNFLKHFFSFFVSNPNSAEAERSSFVPAKRHVFQRAAVIFLVLLVAACGGPEEKKLKFLNKGKALYDKGDFVKARLEFKNSIQIDPKFADAYRHLGMAEIRGGSPKAAFGAFSKAVELNPADLDSQAQLGRLLLAGQEPG